MNNRRYYEEQSVTITSGLTTGEYHDVGQRIRNVTGEKRERKTHGLRR